MPYTYDDQLVEAAGVRRRRLVAAVLYGPDRLRRTWNPGVRSLIHGAFVAVLICAVCVAISFIGSLLSKDPALHRPRAAAVAPAVVAGAER